MMRQKAQDIPDPPRSEADTLFWKALTLLVEANTVAQGELAAYVGVSQGYVSKILAGKQVPKDLLRRRFATYFNMDYEEMLELGRQQPEGRAQGYSAAANAATRRYDVRETLYGGEPHPRGPGLGGDYAMIKSMLRDIKAREVHNLYYTEVPLREATGSMGGGSTETGTRALTYLSFRTEWIRSKGNPEYMTVIRAFGDSMAPTIGDGSVVLIDESRRQFVKNKIYYLRYNGQMYIKRLVERDGHIAIASDNDANLYLVSDADDFEIIGRCIWTGRDLD